MTDKYVRTDRDVCFTKVDRVEGAEWQDEAYRLIVDKHKVCIYATGDAGMFRAKQTLEQLTAIRKGKKYVPVCDITDWPAFRVRGFMHDIGRSFIPMDELKKEIEPFQDKRLPLASYRKSGLASGEQALSDAQCSGEYGARQGKILHA